MEMIMEMFVKVFVSFLLVSALTSRKHQLTSANVSNKRFKSLIVSSGPTLLMFVFFIVFVEVIVCVTGKAVNLTLYNKTLY